MKGGDPVVRGRGAAAIVVSMLVLGVYAPTIQTGPAYGDSAELAAACHALGVAHPTGYPLYTLLGHAFTRVPVGTVAFRVNAMSAVFAAAACGLVVLVALEIGSRWIGAGVAAATLAGSPTFWGHAVRAEVYAPSLVLLLAGVLCALRWRAGGGRGVLLGLAVVGGVALSHHLATALLFAIPAWIGLRSRPREVLDPRNLLPCIGLALLPLASLAYLPIAASTTTGFAWGDPVTWDRFRDHVGGALYHPFLLRLGLEGALLNLAQLASSSVVQVGWIGLGLAGVGILRLALDSREDPDAPGGRPGPAIGAWILLNAVYASLYDIPDIEAYFLPTHVALALLAGMGAHHLAWIWDRMAGASSGGDRRRLAVHLPLVAVLLASPVARLATGVGWFREQPTARPYLDAVVEQVPEGAILLAGRDESALPLLYLRYVEEKRTDLVLVAPPLVRQAWYREHLAETHPGLAFPSSDDPRVFARELVELHGRDRPVWTRDLFPRDADEAGTTGWVLERKRALTLDRAPARPYDVGRDFSVVPVGDFDVVRVREGERGRAP